ncbi:MAG: hypothetical protein H6624_09360 [Bdellovibrionaceae bacterium]|nr:hypothetical protein [Bdellovibrionales bacterium]MCB9084542.1 hypothetical protein [Pseudobdellovibrionaceae bacterium]
MLRSLIATACLSLIMAGWAHADVIDPIGDENLGYIKVDLPPNSTANPAGIKLVLIHKSTNKAEATLSLGVSARVLKGTKCLQLKTPKYTHSNCSIQVKAKETTQVTLGHLTAYLRPELYQIGFGEYPHVLNNQKAGTNLFNMPEDFKDFAIPDDLVFSVDVPGSTESFGFLRRERALGEGEIASMDLSPSNEPRSSLTYSFAKQPAFPDAEIPCKYPTKAFLVERDGKYRANIERSGIFTPHPYDFRSNVKNIENWKVLPIDYSSSYGIRQYRSLRPGQTIRYYTKRSTETQYDLVINNIPHQFHLMPGQTLSVEMPRLDINHVLVTREDGSTYYQAGTYRVQYRDDESKKWQELKLTRYNGSATSCGSSYAQMSDFPTKTGLDVPPKLYRVTVTYTTREGSQQYVTEVDMRGDTPNSNLVEPVLF